MAAPTLVNAQITDAVSPSTVNPQITDSVTQANIKVLGDAPAIAMGNLFLATSQALANAAHNATNNQQQSYVTMQAATTAGVALLYAVDGASDGVAASPVLDAQKQLDSVAAEARRAVEKEASAPEAAADAGTDAAPGLGAAGDAEGGVEVDYRSAAALMRTVMEQFAASLDRLNAVAVRQAIRQVELAAVTVCFARASAVDSAAENAAEQAKHFTDLADTIIRLMNDWADSLGR